MTNERWFSFSKMSCNSSVQLALRARSTLTPFGKSLLYTIRGKLSAGVPHARGFADALPQLTKDSDIQFFKDILGPSRVITDPDECMGYNVDWSKSVRGYSSCVLKPKTTDEVSKILGFCNTRKLAVCPQGGNTGLVGGSVPVFDEIVLSTALMDKIIDTDVTAGVLVCQAGCILENLENHLGEHELMMPLDLGAKGSCHIGGNVKADGEVVDCLSTLKKDNTGFHLKHLFIGSEGTLGIVTKHKSTDPYEYNSFENILKTLKKAKSDLGEILSSCEMMDHLSLDVVTSHLKLKSPLEVHPFYMVIETHGSNNDHDEEKLNSFLESAMEEGLIMDGTATNEVSKMKSIWDLRERITEGLARDGYMFKYDISLPTENFYSLVPVMQEREVYHKIEPFIFEKTSKLKGSVSAEHGIGFKKPKYVHYSKSDEAIVLMKQLKSMMDPNGILNPYKNNYKVTRGNFGYLEEEHILYFQKLLGDARVLTDLSDLEHYNVDRYFQVRGSSQIVLKPKTTEEVSKILSFCNENKLAICPQGGNTDVVGASVPVFDEIVVSTELMNEIIDLDENSGVIVCQAGCVLENIDKKLEANGLMVPLDLGAKGSCHIGGNVSTNAGGLRLLRYGNLHGNVLGLEVVKANGEIMDCLSTLKKDNTGFHLKHLFIGSEGTLGFITKVSLQCPPRPKSLQNFDKVLKTFRKAKEDLCEILSALEVMDSSTIEFSKDTLGITSPIGNYPFYLLIETSGSNPEHDADKLHKFLDTALWAIREKIPDGFKHSCVLCYDFSLPLSKYYDLVEEMRDHMGGLARKVFGFGHLGDGNLHLQIEVEELNKEIKERVEPHIFERVKQMKGSISAEHGMGFLKANYLNLANPAGRVAMMRNLKNMLDPKGILNPYKVFPWA
nr:unnamed protein product [Callosobruchus chinensis]